MEPTTTAELIRRLLEDARELDKAWDASNKEAAVFHSRAILSLGSKIHQRLGVLVEIDRDARWHAAVDRAVKAAPPKPELPGQTSILDAVKSRKPRKPKTSG